jgi:hypothetical protein
MTTIKGNGRESDPDCTIWFKARDDDPEDFVSVFPWSVRASRWCDENNIDPTTGLDMTNDQAWELYDDLVAQGFEVMGCS